jgi:YVTN family beta-propeller protein
VIAKPHLARFAGPFGVAATPDGSKVYVTHGRGVSVIDTATNGVIATIPTRFGLSGAAVTPDGSKVYVTGANTVLVIDTASDTVVGSPIPVGSSPFGVAVTPDGSKVYVANSGDNTVSVIDTATNMVVAVLPVGQAPFAFGVFIQPRFAGTPGKANCHGKSISALAQTFGGLNAAAIALGFPTVETLHTAVAAFCGASS